MGKIVPRILSGVALLSLLGSLSLNVLQSFKIEVLTRQANQTATILKEEKRIKGESNYMVPKPVDSFYASSFGVASAYWATMLGLIVGVAPFGILLYFKVSRGQVDYFIWKNIAKGGIIRPKLVISDLLKSGVKGITATQQELVVLRQLEECLYEFNGLGKSFGLLSNKPSSIGNIDQFVEYFTHAKSIEKSTKDIQSCFQFLDDPDNRKIMESVVDNWKKYLIGLNLQRLSGGEMMAIQLMIVWQVLRIRPQQLEIDFVWKVSHKLVAPESELSAKPIDPLKVLQLVNSLSSCFYDRVQLDMFKVGGGTLLLSNSNNLSQELYLLFNTCIHNQS
jgi:hypothetical protein